MFLVPRHATPRTPHQMAARIVELYRETYGRTPAARTVAWLLTLLWHENRGGQAIQNHNWGNLMAGPNWGGDAWAFKPPQDGEPTAFRAYPSHEDGSRAWWGVLHRPDGTHLRIVRAAESGTARDFFAAISTPHPKTGMQYCASCGEPQFRVYQQIHDQILRSGIVSGLPVGARRSTGGGAVVLLGLAVVAFVALKSKFA